MYCHPVARSVEGGRCSTITPAADRMCCSTSTARMVASACQHCAIALSQYTESNGFCPTPTHLCPLQVAPDELDTAAALVAFMYTGSLPSLSQEDMLTLMKLADRYQVKNCPAACARK